MRTILLGAVTVALLASPVLAAGPARTARYYPPPPPEAYLTPDEARDYARDQLDRRQEMEREALRMRQKAERRARGLDND